MEQNLSAALALVLAQQQQILDLLQASQKKKKVREHRPTPKTSLHEQIQPHRGQYSPREIEKFLLYWGEKNQKGVELWQTKPTWDIKGRLRTWMMNVEDKEQRQSHFQAIKKVNEQPTQRESTDRTDSGFDKPSFNIWDSENFKSENLPY